MTLEIVIVLILVDISASLILVFLRITTIGASEGIESFFLPTELLKFLQKSDRYIGCR